jgi:hypothetical protein
MVQGTGKDLVKRVSKKKDLVGGETKVALKVKKLLSFTGVGEPTLPILYGASSGPFSLSSPSHNPMDAMHLSSLPFPLGN